MRWRSALLRSVLALGVLAGIVALTLYWAGRSETVLRWGVQQGANRLPGKLTVVGLRGSLTEPVSIASLQYTADGVSVDAQGVQLSWSPWLLALSDRVSIEQLRIDELRVVVRSESSGPPALPVHLRLPLPVQVTHLEIAKLTIERNGTTIALSDVLLAYEGGNRFHHLQIERLTTQWGTAVADLRLAADHPFVLDGELRFDAGAQAEWPYSIQAKVRGHLAAISAEVHARVRDIAVDGEARIAPFDPVPLQALTTRSSGLDLRHFIAGAPSTALDVRFEGRGVPSNGIEGKVSATNRLAGPLDQQRLPVKAFGAQLTARGHAVQLPQAEIDLGSGGQMTGAANFEAGVIDAHLRTANLDLRGVHSALRSTHLAGTISTRVDRSGAQVQADVAQDRMHFTLQARSQDDALAVQALTVRAGPAQMSASGRLALSAPNAFSAAGELARFDPAAFGDFPAASINGHWSVAGQLRPTWQAALEYRLASSTFRQEPLTGQGKLTLSAARVREVEARVALAANRLRLSGAFGAENDRLDFELDAPVLNTIGEQWSGAARATGRITGTVRQPACDLSLTATALGTPGGYKVGSLEARGKLEQADDPKFDIQAQARDLSAAGVKLSTLTLRTSGTLGRHDAELRATASDLDLIAHLEGGWRQAAHEWAGHLLALENRGDYAFKMATPALLSVGRERLAFGPARVDSATGQLSIGETRYGRGELTSSGTLSGLSSRRLMAWAKAPQGVQSTLLVGGRWNVVAGQHVNGRIELYRESGDVTMVVDDERLTLGLTQLAANVDVVNDRVKGSLMAAADRTGTLSGTIETRLDQRGGNWGIAGNAPLSMALHADVGSLKPLAAVLTRAVAAEGKLKLELEARGTVAEPKLHGRADADRLRFEQVENGVFLHGGVLHATFDDQRIDVTEFTVLSGSGRFKATGHAIARDKHLTVNVEWSADKLPAVQRPDLLLTVTGKGSLALDQERIALRGSLRADQGRVELRDGTTPVLGDDVVIVGSKPRTPLASRVLRTALDLSLDMGPDFRIHGRGLDARLEGQIKLASPGNAPITADGKITVSRGSFEAYNRLLDIETGTLYFSGPVDNPGLNIRAMRKNQQVEAGVEITGTARAPRVRLVSNPEVPDSEKLSWLVLGRKADAGSQSDSQALQRSGAALLAGLGTSPLQTQLRQTAGLDELSFAPGESAGEGGVVTLGKRISDRIYVIFEQNLSAASNTLKVNYQLSRRWSLRTETGKTDALDLFYSFSFD